MFNKQAGHKNMYKEKHLLNASYSPQGSPIVSGIDNFRLTTLFETGITDDPLDEILTLIVQTNGNADVDFIRQIHYHIIEVFSGAHPGFQASTTKYHNLRHTQSVVLATVRLFHGLMLDHHRFPPHLIEQCILCAYFHDTGLLLQTSETADSGASYTKFHEERSIRFLNHYLSSHKAPENLRENCATIIKFTNLRINPNTLPISSEEARLSGQILGSADILAQMANRCYLECLPLLFQEHQTGGIQEHASALDLMKHTATFFQNVIEKRLREVFGNIAQSMRTHFLHRWQLDQDLYQLNISKNITYLNRIVAECTVELACLEKFLRRKPPTDPF
jgi:hypothetical protein